MALVMLVGVFSPLTALAAVEKTEKVTVHKLLAKEGKTLQDIQNALKDKYVGSDKYLDGTQKKEIKDLYTNEATEIEGVFFAWQKEFDGEWKYLAKDGKNAASIQDPTVKGFADGVLGGETTANGYELDTKIFDQSKPTTYKIVEIHSLSSYKSKDGKVLTDKLAVPVEITLPLVNTQGVVKDAHVYPKNTEDKPKIDKNFSADEAKKYMSEEEKTKLDVAIEHKAAFEKAKKLYKEDAKEYTDAQSAYTKDDKDLIEKWGIDFEANTRGKQTLNKKIGDDVEYTVVTDIPTQTKWATAKWDDKMTEGLTYNMGSLSVKLEILNEEGQNKGNYTEVTLTKETDYKVTEDKNGFVLNFEKTGLEKLNNKAQSQKVTLKYSAKINNTTVTDVPESNDVTFHYGNTPGKGNTPIPNRPDNGKITFTKTWEGTAPDGASITVQLYNANTGEAVGEAKTLNASNEFKAEWTGLDNETEYKVVETAVAGYEAEYSKGAVGVLGVKNWKSDNPTPLNPSEPKVITGGKKFVKTNQDGTERLAGAEFYVKNSAGEYLVAKTSTEQNAASVDLTKKKEALNAAVKAYNELTAEQQKTDTEKKAAIDKAQKEYNDAFKEAAKKYEWVKNAKEADRVLLVSDAQGRFEITGLAYGDYKLEEKTPPEGFAKLNGDIDFRVAKGSYNDVADYKPGEIKPDHIGYNNANDTVKGQQVVNKKVTIPQTGGIGTVIFTVVGISLMAGAVMAMKKNREEA